MNNKINFRRIADVALGRARALVPQEDKFSRVLRDHADKCTSFFNLLISRLHRRDFFVCRVMISTWLSPETLNGSVDNYIEVPIAQERWGWLMIERAIPFCFSCLFFYYQVVS